MLFLPRWSVAPPGVGTVRRANFRLVQLDAVALGITAAATPFVAVFLIRAGASPFEIGLLTTLPAVAGLLLSIPIGEWLQGQRNIVPALNHGRLLATAGFVVTGLISLFAPRDLIVPAVVLVWAAVSIPQAVTMVTFAIVMEGVAGPGGRYELMTRRWSLIGLTNAIAIAITGVVLDRLGFPLGYQVVFIGLPLTAIVSFVVIGRVRLPARDVRPRPTTPMRERIRGYGELLRDRPAFVGFTLRQLVYTLGTRMALPLVPLYYVQAIGASDAWIGLFASIQAFLVLVGYLIWHRQFRSRGGRFVLLATTLVGVVQPAVLPFIGGVIAVAVVAGVTGIATAGLNLVFFDELMKTIPAANAPLFVAVNQNAQNLAGIIGPTAGAIVVGAAGIRWGLGISAVLSGLGFLLFLRDTRRETH